MHFYPKSQEEVGIKKTLLLPHMGTHLPTTVRKACPQAGVPGSTTWHSDVSVDRMGNPWRTHLFLSMFPKILPHHLPAGHPIKLVPTDAWRGKTLRTKLHASGKQHA